MCNLKYRDELCVNPTVERGNLCVYGTIYKGNIRLM